LEHYQKEILSLTTFFFFKLTASSLLNKIIRFNPNIEKFDLSNVIKDINKVIFKIN